MTLKLFLLAKDSPRKILNPREVVFTRMRMISAGSANASDLRNMLNMSILS